MAEKSRLSGQPNDSGANPSRAQAYLSTLEFPMSKQSILEKALAEGADEALLEALRQLPDDRPYTAPPDPAREREGPVSVQAGTYSSSIGNYYDPTTGSY